MADQPEPDVWFECACGASRPLPGAADVEPTRAECGASLAAAVSIAMDARAAGLVDRLNASQPSFARANGSPGRVRLGRKGA